MRTEAIVHAQELLDIIRGSVPTVVREGGKVMPVAPTPDTGKASNWSKDRGQTKPLRDNKRVVPESPINQAELRRSGRPHKQPPPPTPQYAAPYARSKSAGDDRD